MSCIDTLKYNKILPEKNFLTKNNRFISVIIFIICIF